MLKTEHFMNSSHLTLGLASASLALILSGCGHKSDGGGQVLARVNDKEITVLQVNAYLAQHPGRTPDRQQAEQHALDDLVKQELLVQKAADLKLEQQPDIQQQIELSRREILAAAAARQVLAPAAGTSETHAPGAAEVHAFYVSHPELFGQRRIFNGVAFSVPSQMVTAALRGQLKKSHAPADTTELLDDARVTFKQQQIQIQPESVPGQILATLMRMQPGDILTLPDGAATTLVQLTGSESAPLQERAVQPQVMAYLTRQHASDDINKKLLALKHDASVTYMRPFIDPETITDKGGNALQNGMKGSQ